MQLIKGELPTRPRGAHAKAYEYLCYDQGWSIRKIARCCGTTVSRVEDALEFGAEQQSPMDDTRYRMGPRPRDART